MSSIRALAIGACILGVGLLSGCSVPAGEASGGSDAPPSSSPAQEPALTVVVLGDSVPFNSPNDCPGCTSYSQGYADAVEEATGQPVTLENLSRHDGAGMADIEEQVLDSAPTRDALKNADVVIVSAGYNDQPPYDDPARPCSFPGTDSTPLEEVIAAAAATTHECVDDVVEESRASLAAVLGTVRELAPNAEVGVMTQYNSWTGWESLDSTPPDEVAAVSDVISYGLEQWNQASCEEAEAIGAVCIDVLPAFNGADGTKPAGDLLAPDYTHPSQAGNDAILKLLLASDLAP
jgi:lysophospholipase L1-like esterase